MDIKTTDLSDQFESSVQVADPLFRNYGGVQSFGGQMVTLKVFEDNSLVRREAESDGRGRVLVVDGGGSLRCALVGDLVAQLACDNNWAGLIINGCIRDAAEVAAIPIGVKALNTNPKRSFKRDSGERQIAVRFASLSFEPDHYVYADEDGILVASQDLLT